MSTSTFTQLLSSGAMEDVGGVCVDSGEEVVLNA